MSLHTKQGYYGEGLSDVAASSRQDDGGGGDVGGTMRKRHAGKYRPKHDTLSPYLFIRDVRRIFLLASRITITIFKLAVNCVERLERCVCV